MGTQKTTQSTHTISTSSSSTQTSPSYNSRIRGLFRRAVNRIVHLLRIRRRWAAVGQALQDNRIQSLFAGLRRDHGHLIRIEAADRAEQKKKGR